MKISLARFVVAACAALIAACACTSGSKSGTAVAGSDNGDQVVATLGDKKITLKEIDEKITAELEKIEGEKFQLRRNQIERVVRETLVKTEATKKGVSEDEWLKQQLEASIKEPSDEEVAKLYAQSQAQLPPGATLESFKPQIVAFLKQQQQRELAQNLFEDLKKKANVTVLYKEAPKPRKQVEAKGPARGPENAKVTIVEFSDFQCPYCSRAHDTVEQVMQSYAGKVRLVFRQFPLSFHENAPKAAEAALCANDQGKFWEYHDLLFKNQQKLLPDDLKAHAASMGLDAGKFKECLDSGRMAATVKTDTEAGSKVGVSGTPAFFINGVMLSGAQPMQAFKEVIDAELAEK